MASGDDATEFGEQVQALHKELFNTEVTSYMLVAISPTDSEGAFGVHFSWLVPQGKTVEFYEDLRNMILDHAKNQTNDVTGMAPDRPYKYDA